MNDRFPRSLFKYFGHPLWPEERPLENPAFKLLETLTLKVNRPSEFNDHVLGFWQLPGKRGADTIHHAKVRFYGIDLSGAQDGAFPQARRAVDFAITFLARRDAAAAQSIREKLEPYLKKF